MTSNLELFPSHTRAAAIMETMHAAASAEWYSRPDHVDLARQALGPFDLDPASCPKANAVVRARSYGGRQEDGSFVDGLALPTWSGCLWLNPPSPVIVVDAAGTKSRVPGTGPKFWWKRLVDQVERGHTTRACYVAYSIEQLQQSHGWAGGGILKFADAVCFPSKRVDFYAEGASGELQESDAGSHASAYALLLQYGPRGVGDDLALEAWCDLFAPLGTIVVERP